MAQREQRARAAKKAIRRKYTDLTTAVTQGTIPGALYEQEIIDDETLEISSKSTLTDKEKGSKIMNDVRKAVQSNPDLFSGFCKALERESILKELSDELKGISCSVATTIYNIKLRHRRDDWFGVSMDTDIAHTIFMVSDGLLAPKPSPHKTRK